MFYYYCKILGEFLYGLAQGYGLFMSKSKFSFEGEYIDNKENGYGIEINEYHNVYVGEYKDGYKAGIGMYYFSDGGKYEGEFSNGNLEGWVSFLSLIAYTSMNNNYLSNIY